MAKRELISREEVLSHPFANGKYDHKNADINFILGHESYKEWLETLPVFTEQEIVKPYLEKLKEQIVGKSSTEEFFDEDAFNSMYSESVSKDTAECESYIEMTIIKMDDVLRLIDNLLSEQEAKHGSN